MKQYKNSILFICIAFLLSSCASILNSKTTSISIATSQPATLVIENDTIQSDSIGQSITVSRSQQPLKVEVIQKERSERMNVYSRNSVAYYANFSGILAYGVPTLIGLAVDNKNPKRYAYPKTVFIDVNENIYTTTNRNNLVSYNTILKTRPFSGLNPYKNPRIEFALERITNEKWSTQYGAAYMLPEDMYFYDLAYLNGGVRTGYGLSIEQKYYFAKTAPHGFYTSLEGRYMSRESDVIGDFFEITSINADSYKDTFYLVSQASSVNLKIGYQKIVSRIAFDVFVGIGFTNTNIVHLERKYPNDVLGRIYKSYYNSVPTVIVSEMNEGKEWNTTFPIGFQIGWAF